MAWHHNGNKKRRFHSNISAHPTGLPWRNFPIADTYEVRESVSYIEVSAISVRYIEVSAISVRYIEVCSKSENKRAYGNSHCFYHV